MSELKRRHINEVMDMFCLTKGDMNWAYVYYADDADKVIAQLKADYKEACDRLQTANLIKDEQLAETRRQKYKRCIDKSELCELKYHRNLDLHRKKDIDDKYYRCSPLFKKRLFKIWLYEKWTYKWIELAEKLKDKEAK